MVVSSDLQTLQPVTSPLVEFIQKVPKAELHLHIEGTLEPELMFAIAERNGVKLPYDSLQQARDARQFKDLQSFLDLYYSGCSCLLNELDFYELALGYLSNAAAQNIKHVEIFFDPQTHTARGVSWSVFLPGLLKACKYSADHLGTKCHLIMCFLRHLGPKQAFETLLESLPYKEHIVAVGLDSTELGHPPSDFVDVFDRAREEGYLTVAHAGEEGPADYIWQALQLLHVSRLDHGVRCIEDPSLMTHLAATQIPLTVCPLSNIRLKVYNGEMEEVFQRLVSSPLAITLNSDDPAYFGGYINENYEVVAAACGLGPEKIADLAKASFRASFISDEEKERYCAMVDTVLAQHKMSQH